MNNPPRLYKPGIQEKSQSLFCATRAVAAGLAIPLVYSTIITGGYLTNEDNGGAQYARSATLPTTPGYFQDITGAYFALVGATVNLKAMGAKGDGIADDTTAFRNAITKANGAPIYAPRGNYKITSATVITVGPMIHGIFAPGPKIYGDGIDVTTFTYTGTDGYMLDVTVADFATQKVMNSEFKNFTIIGNFAVGNNGGIRCRASYMLVFDHLRIAKMGSDGISVVSTLTDIDGCTWATISHCFIELNKGWGINAGSVYAGSVSLGFLSLKQNWLQYNGVVDGLAKPTSGGMCWKGLICRMETCGFTLNYNVGFYSPGRSTNLTMVDNDFENHWQKAILLDGIVNFYYTGGEFLSAVPFPTTHFLEIDCTVGVAKNVLIENTTVRAYDGYPTPTKAFWLHGTNGNMDLTSCRVRNIRWLDFDYTGQVRIEGFAFDQIDDNNILQTVSATSLRYSALGVGKGSHCPIRAAGPVAQSGGGVRSQSGEWIEAILPGVGIAVASPADAVAAMRYIYIQDVGGFYPFPQLVASTTAPNTVLDPLTGYQLHPTDLTKRYVGRWMTDAAGNWVTLDTGYLNPARVPMGSGQLGYMWRRATTPFSMYMNGSLPTTDTDGTVI